MKNLTNTRRTLRSTPARMENVEARRYMSFTPAAPRVADLSTAVPMGTVTTIGTTRTDAVGSIDRQDFFSFRVSTRGKVNVTLSGLRADADLTVFNSSRTRIGGSSLSGTATDRVSTTLSPGLYYARVHSYDLRSTSFSLNVKRDVPDRPTLPREIARADDTFTYDEDWYYQPFTVTGGNIQVRLNFNSTWAADAMIVNSASARDSFINGSSAALGYAVFDNQTGHDFATLSPGQYWVVVRNQSSGTNSMNFTLTQIA